MNSPVRKSTEGEFIDAPWGKLTWYASRKLGNSTTMTFGRTLLFVFLALAVLFVIVDLVR